MKKRHSLTGVLLAVFLLAAVVAAFPSHAVEKVFPPGEKGGKNRDGVTWKISEDGKRITLYWGEKPTGGYAIYIESLTVEGGLLKVVYRLRSPGPGEAVTQAITYPKAAADLPEGSGPFARVVLIKAGSQSERIVFRIGRNEYATGKGNMPMDASPFLENGRAYVPVRYMAEALGVPGERVVWSPSVRTVTIFKDGVNLVFAVGGNILHINDSPVKMDAAPVLRDGRTCLPARYMAEALGCRVEWDEGEQAVLITPPGQ
ncbi:MAG: stalk domain-containing protein [Bacillota bacterium]